MLLFNALNFKEAILLIFTFRIIDRIIDRDRIYSQNLNINLNMFKFRYINIKILTQFVIIVFIIIKLLNLFRRIYIYVLLIFEACAFKSVIQKIVIVNFLLIVFKIFIKIIIFIFFKVIIFKFLNLSHLCS